MFGRVFNQRLGAPSVDHLVGVNDALYFRRAGRGESLFYFFVYFIYHPNLPIFNQNKIKSIPLKSGPGWPRPWPTMAGHAWWGETVVRRNSSVPDGVAYASIANAYEKLADVLQSFYELVTRPSKIGKLSRCAPPPRQGYDSLRFITIFMIQLW